MENIEDELHQSIVRKIDREVFLTIEDAVSGWVTDTIDIMTNDKVWDDVVTKAYRQVKQQFKIDFSN
jgi:hypothetical protein